MEPPQRTWKELRTKFDATSLLFINVNINVCQLIQCQLPKINGELRCSVDSEVTYLIKKYLMGNPVVKRVSLKGTGPMRPGAIGSLESKYQRHGEIGVGEVEASEGYVSTMDIESLVSCPSVERLAFENVGFYVCCKHRERIGQGRHILPSVKQLILNDSCYSALRITIKDEIDQWPYLERVTIHNTLDPVRWKAVTPKIKQLKQHKPNVTIDLSDVWLLVTLEEYEYLRKERKKGLIIIQHIFLRISKEGFHAILPWRHPKEALDSELCRYEKCWWNQVSAYYPHPTPHWNHVKAEKSLGMNWFHSVHCGDILELANSCVEGPPGSLKEFKEAEVVHIWEICDISKREEWSAYDAEFRNLESRTDLWLELRF